MSGFFIGLLTVILILVSVFLVFLVLMQRSSGGGLGAAMGGGMAEGAFGVNTTNVLAKGTIYGAVLFLTIAFGLYLIYLDRSEDAILGGNVLPDVIEENVGDEAPLTDVESFNQEGDTVLNEGVQSLFDDVSEDIQGIGSDAASK